MSRTVWQLHDAKDRLSELVERAITSGPQFIAKGSRPVAVLLSADEYETLAPCRSRPKLVDILLRCPVPGFLIEKTRGHSGTRERDRD
jgi:antitoxin Phd